MNQITHKLNINTKDLVQLLIENGLLDGYFTNADVNNLFISQVNNNEKVVQVEVGLNIGLDYLKAIEDETQEQFEKVCDCEECSDEEYLYNKMNNNTKDEVQLFSFLNEFAKAVKKYESSI